MCEIVAFLYSNHSHLTLAEMWKLQNQKAQEVRPTMGHKEGHHSMRELRETEEGMCHIKGMEK